MKRNEVKQEYKWCLEDIFATDKHWEVAFDAVKPRLKEIINYSGKLSSGEVLLEALRLEDELGLILEQLYVYARMRKDENSGLDKYVAMSDRIESLVIGFNSYSSFLAPELSSLPIEKLTEYIDDVKFSDYDYTLKEIIRNKAHILSAAEEKIIAMSRQSTGMFHDIFNMIDNVDLPLPTLNINGEKVKLTHGTFSKLLQNSDASIRKKAFEGMYGAFKSLINTIAANYSGNVKKDNFYATVRGYKDCLEKALDGDDIPREVYDNLIKTVGDNLKGVHRYVALRKKLLNVKTLNMYDMYVPIVQNAEISVDYEQAYNIVMEGLKPLGEEYAQLLTTAKTKGWIDVEETENKRSGAYSWGAYGTHPYVLLNYNRTTHDVFTIAHELGHAMHTYYSDANQPQAKAGYAIFVAEVASTVNEVMLLKHLIRTVKDDNVKKYLLSYYLDMFRTTLFRQTMFAEFERNAHDMDLSGEPLTVESLSTMYYELNKKYYGKAVKHNESIRYEWARIPHFYTSFYVYKYATGLTSAINIVKKLEADSNYIDTYKKFLKAGGSKSPYEILADADVDLKTDAPYLAAAKEFELTLKELEEMC